LECFDKTQGLLHISANSIIVDLHGADLASGVDDEKTTKGGTVHGVIGFFDENVVVAGDILADISEQGVVNFAEATLGAGSVDPGQVSEVRVGGSTNEFSVQVFELLDSLGESNQFGGADVGEVEGVEQEHEVLASVVRLGDLSELGANDGVHVFEIGSLVSRLEVGAGGESADGGGGVRDNRFHLIFKLTFNNISSSSNQS